MYYIIEEARRQIKALHTSLSKVKLVYEPLAAKGIKGSAK